MESSVHFSSKSDNWATPQDYFDGVKAKFNFVLDVCADFDNAKTWIFFNKEEDGLKQDWVFTSKAQGGGDIWMNPPYGRTIKHWVKKAYETSLEGATVVCLLPARTDTAWWHDYCMEGEIHFIRGRLKFGGHKNPAPFPSALVVFRGKQ